MEKYNIKYTITSENEERILTRHMTFRNIITASNKKDAEESFSRCSHDKVKEINLEEKSCVINGRKIGWEITRDFLIDEIKIIEEIRDIEKDKNHKKDFYEYIKRIELENEGNRIIRENKEDLYVVMEKSFGKEIKKLIKIEVQ